MRPPTALFFNKSAPYLAFSVQNLHSPPPMFQELPLFQLRADEAIVVPANCTPWCPTHPACPPFVLNSSTKLGIFIRNYLEPSADVGPAYGELLYDQVIRLSPK